VYEMILSAAVQMNIDAAEHRLDISIERQHAMISQQRIIRNSLQARMSDTAAVSIVLLLHEQHEMTGDHSNCLSSW
jgi:hypothetical protein